MAKKRDTTNERSIRLSDDALNVYDNWPHMEKSKRTSEAIIAYDKHNTTELEQLKVRVKALEKAVEELRERKG